MKVKAVERAIFQVQLLCVLCVGFSFRMIELVLLLLTACLHYATVPEPVKQNQSTHWFPSVKSPFTLVALNGSGERMIG